MWAAAIVAATSLCLDLRETAPASRRTPILTTEDSRPQYHRRAPARFPGIGSNPARYTRRAILSREKIDRKYAAARPDGSLRRYRRRGGPPDWRRSSG